MRRTSLEDILQVRERHLTSAQVAVEVIVRLGQREVSDAAAVTIASWWQAASGTGAVLSAFASGCQVTRQELLDDISATIHEQYGHIRTADQQALDMLGTWALTREVTS